MGQPNKTISPADLLVGLPKWACPQKQEGRKTMDCPSCTPSHPLFSKPGSKYFVCRETGKMYHGTSVRPSFEGRGEPKPGDLAKEMNNSLEFSQ